MGFVSAILGRPLASNEQDDQKIGVVAGVPAMGLDGLTSSAYGPEAALTILLPVGAAGLIYIGPIMLVILALLGMLYFSYRQTIAAYPQNGGSYTVARENLGTWPGLLAAAALMVDYVLNVAVGISAGVAALVSAAPMLHKYTLPLCLGILAVITLINLRGTGEAGIAFALPTYTFIASLSVVLIMGLIKSVLAGGHPHPVDAPPPIPAATEAVTLWLLLRAFASGCTAMTGVEAVSNGVGAFKDPTVPTARRTLTIIVVVLAFLLGAVAFCSRAYGVGAMDQTQHGYQSVLSQLTAAIVGRGWLYYLTLGAVLATLCLSANTSFVGFPRLSQLLSEDGFLPKWFSLVGRRLVYSVGILFLAAAAGALLAVFDGITDRLIPLFAVGAFLAFTLSQAGMVVHWRRELRGDGAAAKKSGDAPAEPRQRVRARLWVNATGAVATGIALGIILAAKFVEGAWITVVVIPLLLLLFRQTHRHYQRVIGQIATHEPLDLSGNDAPVVLVPMRNWDRLSNKAMRFAFRLSRDVIGVHLCNVEGADCGEDEQRVRDDWAADVQAPAAAAGLPAPRLDMLQSPYRRFDRPLLMEIEKVSQEFPGRMIAIIVAEVVGKHWWDLLLHRQRAARLRHTLLQNCDRRVIVITVPWYLEE
jgi:amino acid transporter